MKIQGLVDALEEVVVKAGMEEVSCLKAGKVANLTLSESPRKERDSLKAREKAGTELQLLYIFVLGKTCLVVLVAKHPILFIASLFFYILL